ncbi:MAG: flagellar protein FlaG [Anaerolineaceae bacterium]
MNEHEVGRIGAIGTEPVVGYQAGQQVAQRKTAKERMQAVETANPSAKLNIGDIRVSFQVDESANEVVITVSDKESGHIIRTIPFDKMQDISAGSLLQYSK